MLQLNRKNKKALSEVVAYALMISMALAMSGLVYVWLKDIASTTPKETCEENVMLELKDYNCTYDSSGVLQLNITIANRGTFEVGGFILRVSKDVFAKIAETTVVDKNVANKLDVGKNINLKYSIPSITGSEKVELIAIQPWRVINNKKVFCKTNTVDVTCPPN